MQCPYCRRGRTRVTDSRGAGSSGSIRRRRACPACGMRFTTYEHAELALAVRKRDGRRQPFDRQKLLAGLRRAATKRPIAGAELEGVADSIAAEVRRRGGTMESTRVGELALRALASLDRVAAVRFASVYRNFEEPAEFEAELRRLESESPGMADSLRSRSAVDTPDASGDGINMVGSPAGRAGGERGEPHLPRRGHAGSP